MQELLGHCDKLFLNLLPSLSLHFPTLLMACTWLFAKNFLISTWWAWFQTKNILFSIYHFQVIFLPTDWYFPRDTIFLHFTCPVESDGKKIAYLRECFVYCQSTPDIDLHLHNQTQMLSLSTCVFLIFLLNRHKMTSFSAIPTQFLPQWTGKT